MKRMLVLLMLCCVLSACAGQNNYSNGEAETTATDGGSISLTPGQADEGDAEDSEEGVSIHIDVEFLGESDWYTDLDDLGYDFPDPVFTIDEKTALIIGYAILEQRGAFRRGNTQYEYVYVVYEPIGTDYYVVSQQLYPAIPGGRINVAISKENAIILKIWGEE